MSATTSSSRDPHVPARTPVGFALGYAVLGAPAAWALQLIIGYSLAAHACYPNSVPLARPIWGFLWWALIGVDFIALIAAGLAAFFSVTKWAAYRHVDGRRVGERRNQFLSRWALLTTTLFSIAIIFTIVMLFIEPVCDV